MREAIFSMIRAARQHGATVMVNSSDATDHFEKYLDQGAHYIVRGEAEETLKELLTSLLQQTSNKALVKGICFREEATIVTPSRPVLRDLDSLPLPAWDLIDLEPYRQIWIKKSGFFSLNMATTRGCPYKCNWCAKPIYGNRYNSRSPENAVAELDTLLQNTKVDYIWMCDDIFGLKPGWVVNFSQLVLRQNLSFRYKIQSRADLLQDDQLVQALQLSGCESVWIGAESGSQKILDAMDKGITVNQIQRATRSLKSHGIRVGFFLQFGYPGEIMEDIEQTIQMVLDLMPDEIGISVSYPLPGTAFYDQVKDQLVEKENWFDSDDLSLMFHNTYPPTFYKILHRYVHSRYRIRRGWLLLATRFNHSFKTHHLRSVLSMLYHLPLSWIQAHQLKKLKIAHDHFA